MLRLAESERAVAEVVAIAEHVASLTAGAATLRLRADVPRAPEAAGEDAVGPLAGRAEAGDAAGTLAQIREWAARALGIDHVPVFWRALAPDPKVLAATWRKDRLVLASGVLDELTKGCAALAVAGFRQSDYWVAYFTQYLRRHCGVGPGVLVEIAGAVMHYTAFTTIAHGMRLEAPFENMAAADVQRGGRYEHLVPGVRRQVTLSS